VLKIIGWNNGSKKANLSGLSDNELLGLLVQSDKDAFAAIYDRHAPTLYLHIINQICTGTTLEQAQDDTTRMLIKVFASLWHDREKPIYHNTLQEYLLSIANRKLIDYRFFKEVFTDTLP
jgi:DNA-directed RNA polymerase specialized sigma24 family protein